MQPEDCGSKPCQHALAMARVPARRWATRADLYERLSQARAVLDESGETLPTLDEAAASAALSKHHFLRLFKGSFGFTPGQYLARRRIGIAQGYLRDTRLSVTEIALKVGCETTSSFTKLFKQATGVSPSAWRKANSNFGKA